MTFDLTSGPQTRAQTAQEVRDIRRELGLTQNELAERLNSHFTVISRWENGYNSPRPSFMDRLRQLRDEHRGTTPGVVPAILPPIDETPEEAEVKSPENVSVDGLLQLRKFVTEISNHVFYATVPAAQRNPLVNLSNSDSEFASTYRENISHLDEAIRIVRDRQTTLGAGLSSQKQLEQTMSVPVFGSFTAEQRQARVNLAINRFEAELGSVWPASSRRSLSLTMNVLRTWSEDHAYDLRMLDWIANCRFPHDFPFLTYRVPDSKRGMGTVSLQILEKALPRLAALREDPTKQ